MKKADKKAKRTALIMCRNGKQFWTTQKQFWEWVRNNIVVKTQDGPLAGFFRREHEETVVTRCGTVLNLAHPNHLREALRARRVGPRHGRATGLR